MGEARRIGYAPAGRHEAAQHAGHASRQRREPIISTKIFVGSLSFQTSQDELVELFSQAGSIVDVYLPSDRITGQPRGFAFVTYASPEEAAAAIERFNGAELGGRELHVNEAEERPQRARPAGGGGRDYGGGGGGAGGGRDYGGGNRGVDRTKRPAKPKGSRRGLRAKKRSL